MASIGKRCPLCEWPSDPPESKAGRHQNPPRHVDFQHLHQVVGQELVNRMGNHLRGGADEHSSAALLKMGDPRSRSITTMASMANHKTLARGLRLLCAGRSQLESSRGALGETVCSQFGRMPLNLTVEVRMANSDRGCLPPRANLEMFSRECCDCLCAKIEFSNKDLATSGMLSKDRIPCLLQTRHCFLTAI